jgi:hypothetical protein
VDGLCRFVNAVTAVALYLSARPRILGAAFFDRSAPNTCPAAGLERVGLILAGIDPPPNATAAAAAAGPAGSAGPEEAYCLFLWYAGVGLGVLHSVCLAVVIGVLVVTPLTWWATAKTSEPPGQPGGGRPAATATQEAAAPSRARLRDTKAGQELAAAARMSLG